MKRYKCVVTREDEYIIEFDESRFNEEKMAEFRKHFYKFYSYEEHARHIAQHKARFDRSFIEGYGIPLVNGKVPYIPGFYSVDDIEEGINIQVISEDESCDVEVTEI